MLGRNSGCSWWFEVRRDWPRVTLNKYTATSQGRSGCAALAAKSPLINQLADSGWLLCTLPHHHRPFPRSAPAHQLHPRRRWWNRGSTERAEQLSSADGAATKSCICNKHTCPENHRTFIFNFFFFFINSCKKVISQSHLPLGNTSYL